MAGAPAPKEKMMLAALDLLREAGLSGAGINSVIDKSGAPKGSLYHYFPGGKHELIAAALRTAEASVGDGLRRAFGRPAPLGEKVRALFVATGSAMETHRFTRGCPVAAVTLDLDDASEELRQVCGAIFDGWLAVIGEGLAEVPAGERRSVAQLILATLEGAMILARARSSKDTLVGTGAGLADVLEAKFKPKRRRVRRR
jgi:TetR/AcrR family transcriptional repressor of lmrAB and yxaGH operons